MIGIGFYAAAMFAAFLSVGVLSGFRWIEHMLPHQTLLHLTLAFPRDCVPGDEAVRELVGRHGFEVVDWAFQLGGEGSRYEFQLVLQAMGKARANDLAKELSRGTEAIAFRIAPSRS
jgi:putative Mg2+ transporter-C (MgtC) family protein